MSLNEEVSQAIQKNLPAAVAGELKTYLAQAEKDKETIIALTEKNKNLEERCTNGDKAYGEAKAKLDAHAALDTRETAVSKRENDLELTLAKMKAEAAEKRAEDIHGLVATVFRNPTIKRNLYKHESMNSSYNSATGQYVNTPTGSSSVTEEISEE